MGMIKMKKYPNRHKFKSHKINYVSGKVQIQPKHDLSVHSMMFNQLRRILFLKNNRETLYVEDLKDVSAANRCTSYPKTQRFITIMLSFIIFKIWGKIGGQFQLGVTHIVVLGWGLEADE